jgi:hypothetical protein
MTNINEVQTQVEVTFSIDEISVEQIHALSTLILQISKNNLHIGEKLELIVSERAFEEFVTGVSYTNEWHSYEKRICEVEELVDEALTVWKQTNNNITATTL